jgi:hypothetical protein
MEDLHLGLLLVALLANLNGTVLSGVLRHVLVVLPVFVFL